MNGRFQLYSGQLKNFQLWWLAFNDPKQLLNVYNKLNFHIKNVINKLGRCCFFLMSPETNILNSKIYPVGYITRITSQFQIHAQVHQWLLLSIRNEFIQKFYGKIVPNCITGLFAVPDLNVWFKEINNWCEVSWNKVPNFNNIIAPLIQNDLDTVGSPVNERHSHSIIQED